MNTINDQLTTSETFKILKEATISEMKGLIGNITAHSEAEITAIKNLIQKVTDDLEKLDDADFQTETQVKEIVEMLLSVHNSGLKTEIIKEVTDKVEQLIINVYDESWITHKIEDIVENKVPNIVKNTRFGIKQLFTEGQLFSAITFLVIGAFFVGTIWVQIFLMRSDIDKLENMTKTLDAAAVAKTINEHIVIDKENYKALSELKNFKNTEFPLHTQQQNNDLRILKLQERKFEKDIEEHHKLIQNLKFEFKVLKNNIKRICKENDC